MALHTMKVTVIGQSGKVTEFTMPRKDEFGQPYTMRQVNVLAKHRVSTIGYSGQYKVEVH